MQQYPSILGSKHAPLGKPCIAFYKYDGSNLRFEWNPKKGWHKFGTRRHLFDETDPTFGPAIEIFMTSMADTILKKVKKAYPGIQKITAFAEYFGPNSFAGSHDPNDEKELRLIDIFLYKKGFMDPREFVKLFESQPWCAEVIYKGNINKQFIQDVQQSKYPVWEGVIAKCLDGFMVKIKTKAYFDKLGEVFGRDYQYYWE